MQITLPPDLEKFIQTQLNSGSFLSADEVVQEALRLFQRTTAPHDLTVDQLQEALQIGIDDINAGRSKVYPTATALATDIKQMARQQQSRSSH
jgi:antitoxin ParD1/3/4